jgi:spore germination cell wall hydrolase CwlJ-like protein
MAGFTEPPKTTDPLEILRYFQDEAYKPKSEQTGIASKPKAEDSTSSVMKFFADWWTASEEKVNKAREELAPTMETLARESALLNAQELAPTMETLARESALLNAQERKAAGFTQSLKEGGGEAYRSSTNTDAGGVQLPDGKVPEYRVYESPDEMSDVEILARTIEAEARGESYKGKIAVGATIANRAAAGSYGEGIKGVILKEGQFSPWNSYTGYAKGEQGKDMMKLKPSEGAYKAAMSILSGKYEDPTGGATHYVNESVSKPDWLDDMKGRQRGTKSIGRHTFGNADSETTYDGKRWVINRDDVEVSPRPKTRPLGLMAK